MSAPRPGFRHESIVVGSPPEHRTWTPAQRMFAPLIAASAQLNAFVTVDAGVERHTRVGEQAFLMAHTHVGHDALIGNGCELAPGTVIGGYAALGDGVHCGIGVLVLPRRLVGKGARLGAGAVVTKDVPAGSVYVGNPARRLEKNVPRGPLTACEEQGWEELALARGVDPEWIDWWHRTHPENIKGSAV